MATVTSRDYKSEKSIKPLENARPLNEQVGGALNPEWLEWYMDWPIGYTALEPLEMDKTRSKLPWPGGF